MRPRLSSLASRPTARAIRVGLVIPAAIVLASACGGKDRPTQPAPALASLIIGPANPSIPDGQSVQLGVTFRNSSGQAYTPNPLPAVTWSSSAITVASVSGTGLVSAERRGQATITATAAGVSAQTSVTVTPVATTLSRVSGDDQDGAIGIELPEPFVVAVRDRHGDPVQGVSVSFSVTSGGGELSHNSGVSDADGRASTRLTLGASPGANTVAATAVGLQGSPVQFTATAESPPLECEQVRAFGAGESIAGTLPGVLITGPVTTSANVTICGDLEIRGSNSNLILAGREVVVEGNLIIPIGDGVLTMTDAADRLIIKGNATFNTAGTEGRLTAGEMHIAGDLSAGGTSFQTFASTGTLVVLNGTAVQKVSFVFPAPASQRFQNLRISNTAGVQFTTNATATGDVELTAGAVAQLEGDTLTVLGDLSTGAGSSLSGPIAIGGALSIGGSFAAPMTTFLGQNQAIPVLPYQHLRVRGTAMPVGNLTVAGDLILVGSPGSTAHLTLAGREVTVEGDLALVDGTSTLTMTDAADRLFVEGSATFSTNGTEGRLTAGELRIAGDLTVLGTSFQSFASTGTLVELNGATVQHVSFVFPGPTAQRFSDLRITNPAGVTLASNVQVNGALDLVRRLTVPNGRTLTMVGALTLRSTAELINSGAMTVGSCSKEAGHTITGTDPCP